MMLNGQLAHSINPGGSRAATGQTIIGHELRIQASSHWLGELLSTQEIVLRTARPLEVLLEVLTQSLRKPSGQTLVVASYATLAALASGHQPSVLRLLTLLGELVMPESATTIYLLRQALCLRTRWANRRTRTSFAADCCEELNALGKHARFVGAARFADQLEVLTQGSHRRHTGSYCQFERCLVSKVSRFSYSSSHVYH